MLYKYLSKRRLDVIDKFKIRFTQPGALNDPFESAMLVQLEDLSVVDKIVEDIKVGAVNYGIVPATQEEQILYDSTISKLINNVNEKFSPLNLGKGVAEMINKSIGVLSLSRTNDSLLMWAHYGDEHKGYVIGLDESHRFFHEPDLNGVETKPHNVVYTSRRCVAKQNSGDFYENLLCRKSLEWAYEQEVRIFRAFNKDFDGCDRNRGDEIHLHFLPRECIKEIYIGANADEETKKSILEIVDRRKLSVKIYQAYLSDERYALDFEEIPLIYSYRIFDRYTNSGSIRMDMRWAKWPFRYLRS